MGRILMAANFVAVKGHRWLLESAGMLHRRGVQFRLDLAGEGPLRAETVEQVRRLGLGGHVRFLGQLPHSELLRRLAEREWDVVLLSSVETVDGEREGIPVILMEAMAAGIPVVAPQIGGIPELLDGGAGLLVAQADAQALADAVERLLRDGELRVRVGETGKRRVTESFSIESVVGALADHFRSCAAPRSSATLPLVDRPAQKALQSIDGRREPEA